MVLVTGGSTGIGRATAGVSMARRRPLPDTGTGLASISRTTVKELSPQRLPDCWQEPDERLKYEMLDIAYTIMDGYDCDPKGPIMLSPLELVRALRFHADRIEALTDDPLRIDQWRN